MPQNIIGTESFSSGVYQKPSSKDTGDNWTDVIESFMDRMANHSHSGADSKKITLNIDKEVQDLVAGVDYTWVDLGNDVYEAEFDLPVVVFYDTNIKHFFYMDGTTPVSFYPTVVRVSNTRMKVRSNKNGFDLRIVYL